MIKLTVQLIQVVAAVLLLHLPAHLSAPLIQEGKASYYGKEFEGRKTANGEKFRNADFTAAHRSHPFNTLLRVTNLKNNLSVTVRVNDRGPYVRGRIVDLSEAAARRIGSYMHGLASVKVEEQYLLRLTPDIDSIFSCYDFLDCLGNPAVLSGYTLTAWKTKNLLHMLYVSNELYLHDDIDHVYIAGKGVGQAREYYLVITGFKTKKSALAFKDLLEKKGFMQVSFLK
jgi:rare lipoprotein A